MFFSEWWRRLWWTNRSGDDLSTCTDLNNNCICDDEEPFDLSDDTDDSWYDTDYNVWNSNSDDD